MPHLFGVQQTRRGPNLKGAGLDECLLVDVHELEAGKDMRQGVDAHDTT